MVGRVLEIQCCQSWVNVVLGANVRSAQCLPWAPLCTESSFLSAELGNYMLHPVLPCMQTRGVVLPSRRVHPRYDRHCLALHIRTKGGQSDWCSRCPARKRALITTAEKVENESWAMHECIQKEKNNKQGVRVEKGQTYTNACGLHSPTLKPCQKNT